MALSNIKSVFRSLFMCRRPFTRQTKEIETEDDANDNPDAYPVFPPPTPEELLLKPDFYREKLGMRLYRTPKETTQDTALFTLYRLYEYIVLNENIGMRNELEFFFYERWPVASIPDPQDHNSKSRYAVLASITGLLVASFNERIKLGIPRKADTIMTREEIEQYRDEERVYEEMPEWAKNVPPLEQTLVIPHEDGQVLDSFDSPKASKQMAEKNILHWQPHIHFI